MKNPYAPFLLKNAFWVGVCLAVVLHAGFYAWGFLRHTQVVTTREDAEVIHVERLLLAPPEPPPPEVKKIVKKVVRAKIIPNIVQDTVPEPEPEPEPIMVTDAEVVETVPVVEEPVAPPPPPPPPPPPKPSKDSLMKVTRAYLMGLSKEFEKRKDYPATARRLKQEGTVRVQFTVARNGAISGAVVAKPCPYSSLNESALAAVQAVSKFEPIPAILEKDSWKMEIPIKYNLHQ
ncbi:energy transducer TonB [Fibrobacter succinogenes]|uniref:energy transducer TonB n=1 Tax=Fibrobacter succinogenes TaxID=833 RepID=UPI001565BE4C|nr:energy transducer TonB [Fibrobacter succinogenes]